MKFLDSNGIKRLLTLIFNRYDQDVTDLKNDIHGITSSISTIETEIDTNSSDISKLKRDMNEIDETLTTTENVSIKASIDAKDAIQIAEIARDSVKTLEGFTNADEASKTLSALVIQITENTSNIERLKNSVKYITREEFDELDRRGELENDVEYNIIEEDE
ncbi:MAG: hypothetical protein IKU29_05180 [Parabacteroides sp.]|nr:hypothetical protein [Parabacteroides sp.]